MKKIKNNPHNPEVAGSNPAPATNIQELPDNYNPHLRNDYIIKWNIKPCNKSFSYSISSYLLISDKDLILPLKDIYCFPLVKPIN